MNLQEWQSPHLRSFEERAASAIAALRVTVVVLAVVVVGALCLGAWGFIQAQNATQEAGATARVAERLAQEQTRVALRQAEQAATLARAVTTARHQWIFTVCQRQNAANTNTLAYIHKVGIGLAAKRHITVAKAEAGLRPFVVLMDNAIPRQNCKQTAAEASPAN